MFVGGLEIFLILSLLWLNFERIGNIGGFVGLMGFEVVVLIFNKEFVVILIFLFIYLYMCCG